MRPVGLGEASGVQGDICGCVLSILSHVNIGLLERYVIALIVCNCGVELKEVDVYHSADLEVVC